MDLHDYVVQIRRGTKRITLQRYLISKIAYGLDFSEVELAALFHNQLWLTAKATTDVSFNTKFGSDLESVSKILSKANFSRGLTDGSRTNCREALLALTWDFLYPKRNVSTIGAKLVNSIYTRWREPEGVETNRLPPEKYIGKGYRDKGTAQRPEYDANPSWQEVASAWENAVRQLKETIDEAERTEGIHEQLKLAEKLKERLERVQKLSSAGRNLKPTEITPEEKSKR